MRDARGAGRADRGTCHELRHTCLTRLREAGMALEAIQAQAGHRSIESTRVYLHLADGWVAAEYRKAAEAIDAQARPGADHDRRGRTAAAPAGPARWEPVLHPGAPAGGDDARLPGPTGRVATTGHHPIDRHRAAVVRLASCSTTTPSCAPSASVQRRHIEAYKTDAHHTPRARRPVVEEQRRCGCGSGCCGCSSNGSSSGAGMTARPAARCSCPTCPESMIRSPSSWTTPRRPGSCGPPPSRTRCRRLIVEMLARTGMRVGELCALAADAVMIIGDAHWLRIPVGKLHHDRLIPLHPGLVEPARRPGGRAVGPDNSGLLLTNHGRPAQPLQRQPDRRNASDSEPGSTGCTPTGCATPSPPKPSTGA